MAVYVIAEFGATEASNRAIARLDKTNVGRFGERMLVDSTPVEVLTGGWSPQRIVVLEFPSIERAQSWWSARERSAPHEVQHVTRKMILVEGL